MSQNEQESERDRAVLVFLDVVKFFVWRSIAEETFNDQTTQLKRDDDYELWSQ